MILQAHGGLSHGDLTGVLHFFYFTTLVCSLEDAHSDYWRNVGQAMPSLLDVSTCCIEPSPALSA